MFKNFKCTSIRHHLPAGSPNGPLSFEVSFVEERTREEEGRAPSVMHYWGLPSCPWQKDKVYLMTLAEVDVASVEKGLAALGAAVEPAPAIQEGDVESVTLKDGQGETVAEYHADPEPLKIRNGVVVGGSAQGHGKARFKEPHSIRNRRKR